MKKMTECRSCGSVYETKLVRCPYCGTAYDPAAEDEYMEQLEDVRVELAGHRGDADKRTGAALVRTFVIFAIAVVLIIVIGICIFILPKNRSRNRLQERKDEFIRDISEDADDPGSDDK